MNGGTFFAFLLTAVMIAVVVLHREPATFPVKADDGATTSPAVVAAPPAPESGNPGEARPMPAMPAAQLVLAPSAPTRADLQQVQVVSEPRDLKAHSIGCAIAGTAGTGLTAVVGPAEVAAMLGASLLVPLTPILIGATLGTAFVTGCAVGAVVSPLVAD